MDRYRIILLVILLLLSSQAYAADHYCSPTGSDTWVNSTNIATPCSLETARSNAAAGDTVFLRGGTYTLSATWQTVNSGSGDADAQRIIFRAYTGETPVLSSDGLGNTIEVEDEYWTLDGLTINSANVAGADRGIIRVGANASGDRIKIQNCTLYISSSAGRDNIACISLQADRADYAYIYNNVIRGQGSANDLYLNCGVQYLGGGNVGTKILNNEIYDCVIGIMVKHANADASIGAAEIAYNYIHDCYSSETALGTGGLYGNPAFINCHDNISDRIHMGDNGGGSQGHNNLINHNTLIGGLGIELWSPSEGPIVDCTITNNIFPTKTTYGSTQSLNTWDYNMYGDDAAIGANDLGTTSPTYTGGATPSTIAGFALTSESAGYQACADSSDMGADVSLVGVDAGGTPETPTCQGISVQ